MNDVRVSHCGQNRMPGETPRDVGELCPESDQSRPRCGSFESPAVLQYRYKKLSFLELWFDTPAPSQYADVLRYWQRPEPFPGGHSAPFYTLLIDLQRAENVIFAAIRATVRAKIRRAETQDGIEFRALEAASPAVRHEFCATFADFASRRGLPGVDPERLRMLADRRMLAISSASRPDLGTIVCHAYILCRGRARLLYSVTARRYDDDSVVRQLAGRANRFLHFADMMHFREHGIHTYDFGGWYEGNEDRERLGINKFKEEFGGRVVCEHNGNVLLTLKGKTFMTLKRILTGVGA